MNIPDIPIFPELAKYEEYYASGDSHTEKARRSDLAKIRAYFEAKGVKKLGDWTHSVSDEFVRKSLKAHKPSTVARWLTTLNSIGRALSESYPGYMNPARKVRAPRVEIGKPKSLSMVEVQSIRDVAENRIQNEGAPFRLVRNYCLFNLMVDTGVRCDEVRGLTFGQLDENLEWIYNVGCKGRKFRNVYISAGIRQQLREYLKAREKILARYFGKRVTWVSLPVFVSTRNANYKKPETFQMSSKGISNALQELALDTHISPHVLRHTFATEFLDDCRDIRLVAQALGHGDVKTTMRYTERHDEAVARAIETARRRGDHE